MSTDESQPEFASGEYWHARYSSGGNSGSGSYGRLAVYKAHVINELVHRFGIKSVLEIGVGDGHQASLFSVRNFCGVDISEVAVENCRVKFKDKAGWTFLSDRQFESEKKRAALVLSLDVIYHLIEDDVFDRYMRGLFAAAHRFVLIYSSNHDAQAEHPHVRHRAYSRWIAENAPEFLLRETLEHPFPRTETSHPRHTSFAFFQLFEKQGRRS